jgi:arylsulfatase A-like enzyme
VLNPTNETRILNLPKTNQASGQSRVIDIISRTIITSVIAGVSLCLMEILLTVPQIFISLKKIGILLPFTFPCIGYCLVFLIVNLPVALVGIMLIMSGREAGARKCEWLYKFIDIITLSLFLVLIYALNHDNGIGSFINQFSLSTLVLISVFFLIITSSCIYILDVICRRNRLFKNLSLVIISVLALIIFSTVIIFHLNSPIESSEEVLPFSTSEDERNNVLLITIDTQRADFLGCYGHPIALTPNIDRLAEEGVLFSYCIAQVPMTLPSHTSIMTSTYPIYHCVRNNSDFKVNNSLVTIAEVLGEDGYQTAGFVSSIVLGNLFGLDQGFDTYDMNLCYNSKLYSKYQKWTIFSRVILQYIPLKTNPFEKRMELTTQKTLEWIVDRGSQPFFLWVHYFNPHTPYAPPFHYAKHFLEQIDEVEEGSVKVSYGWGEKRMSWDAMEILKALYMGEVSYVDYNVGLILDTLEKCGILDRTLVVVTSDHGEAFGENNDIEHSRTLYDTNIHIPLILRWPGNLPEGRVIDGLCQSIDIMPTILDCLDVDGPEEMQGLSLLPVIHNNLKLIDRNGYCETLGIRLEQFEFQGLVETDWKYIIRSTDSLETLYNIAEDPREMYNLAEENPERSDQMREALQIIMANLSSPDKEESIELDSEVINRLRALGYI